ISRAGNALALWVSSSVNRIEVNGNRITPARIAPMPSSGHSSEPWPGNTSDSSAPRPAPSASKGASTPPEVPEEVDDPHRRLHQHEHQHRHADHLVKSAMWI